MLTVVSESLELYGIGRKMTAKYLFYFIVLSFFISPSIIDAEGHDGSILLLSYAKFIQNNPGGIEDISYDIQQHHISIASNLAETGRSFSKIEKHQEAIKKYEEALTHYASGDIYYSYATSLLAVKRAHDALLAFKIAGALGYDINELSYYEIARVFSLLEDAPLAFEYLDIAIMNGFRETERLVGDSDFEFLRLQPEWHKWFEDKKAIFYPDKSELRNWLVVEYLFDGNAFDNGINKLDGNVSGATLSHDRFDKKENAFYFDGQDDFIEIGPIPKIKMSNEITISYWFYLHKLGTDAVCGYISEYQKKALRLGIDAKGHIFIDPGKHVGIKSSNITFTVQRWYHYVMTVKGGGLARVYADGKMVYKTSEGVPDRLEDPPNFSIGAGNEVLIGRSRAHFFNGTIDDFQIYNRVLSEDEIKELYHSTKAH